jgi:hypothetical protein
VRGWIEADVDLSGLSRDGVGHRHLRQAVIRLVDVDLEAFAEQATVDRRSEPIDSGATWAEAVEVTCGAIHHVVSDQCAASGQGEAFLPRPARTPMTRHFAGTQTDVHRDAKSGVMARGALPRQGASNESARSAASSSSPGRTCA